MFLANFPRCIHYLSWGCPLFEVPVFATMQRSFIPSFITSSLWSFLDRSKDDERKQWKCSKRNANGALQRGTNEAPLRQLARGNRNSAYSRHLLCAAHSTYSAIGIVLPTRYILQRFEGMKLNSAFLPFQVVWRSCTTSWPSTAPSTPSSTSLSTESSGGRYSGSSHF